LKSIFIHGLFSQTNSGCVSQQKHFNFGESLFFFQEKKTSARIRNPGAYRAAIIARQQRELIALEEEIRFHERKRKELLELKRQQEILNQKEAAFGYYKDPRGYQRRLFQQQEYLK